MDKRAVLSMMQENVTRIQKETENIQKFLKDYKEESTNYINTLLIQITSSGPTSLLAKTPKVPKKKAHARIKTIPENDEIENDSSLSNVSSRPSKVDTVVLETSEMRPIRSKRGASVKAADIIKKQQSMTLNTKLRRQSDNDEPLAVRIAKETRSKRPKGDDLASSDEENVRPTKQSKLEKKNQVQNQINDETSDIINETIQDSLVNQTMETTRSKRTSVKRKLEDHDDINKTLTDKQSVTIKQNTSDEEPAAKKANYSKSSNQNNEKDSKFMTTLERISEKPTPFSEPEVRDDRRTTRSSSSVISAPKRFNKNNVINETVNMSNGDETIASMYEDAVGKPIPIMNSTMNPNSMEIEKMTNVTVVLEPLSAKKIFNETVTIQKNSFKGPLVRNNSTLKETNDKSNINDVTKTILSSKEMSTNQTASRSKAQKQNTKIDNFVDNDLITDDESSPERKDYRAKKGKLILNEQKRVTRSNQSTASEEEVPQTPKTKIQQPKNYKLSSVKGTYKQPALFSPYAKDSVKKRVEAFEQVAASPKQPEAETEGGGRVTRTKTRAQLAAASFSETPAQTVSQKLARKSLAKAKKISLAKQTKELEEPKENDNGNYRTSKLLSAKTTPLGKTRMLQMPNSVSKSQYATPSNNHHLNICAKPMTASRSGNIVTNVDSFIQPMKSASKQIDRVAEEKRRRAHEEDARKKREELLKMRAEEKRRKREEKELKNKLAREAKEKSEQLKRLKAEKEREEKAKLAQQLQEKQREEMEKKRIAQLQRAQEKEEKRRQEELLRLQRLQEQEEQERQLAEQRRREQEMEKRKLAESKHMAEMKLKSQMDKAILQAKAKIALPKQMPTNYKIDSDPDEEDSDDESKPKYQIPHWALKHVRQSQLAMQKHIPMKLVLRFFDAKKCTPDLRDLFKGIDPKRLKRSSSAIWKTPPRYSMMNRSMTQN